jgi:hypothetical protein
LILFATIINCRFNTNTQPARVALVIDLTQIMKVVFPKKNKAGNIPALSDLKIDL